MTTRTLLAASALAVLLAACGRGEPESSAPASAATLAASAAASTAPQAAQASGPDADAAKAFLAGVYAEYHGDSTPDLFTKPNAYFDAALTAMIQVNDKRTKAGDEDVLDYDPVCDCQDSGGMKADIQVTNATADAATAVATLSYPGPPPPEGPTKVTFDLAKANGVWRIHDIHETDTPSLVAMLQKAIAAPATRSNDEAP